MKRLHAGEFGRAVGWRMGLFVLLTIGFPFILYGIAVVTNCSRIPGACGAVALVASFYLRVPIVLGFLALMIGPSMARTRALGLPGIVGLIVVWLMALDIQHLLVLGAHWSLAFSIGAIYLQMPIYLILALVVIAAMALVREPQSDADGLWQRHGLFGKATLGGVAAVAGLGLLSAMLLAVNMGRIGRPGADRGVTMALIHTWAWSVRVIFVLAAVVAIALIVFVILDRLVKPGDPGSAQPDAPIVPPDAPRPSPALPRSRPLPGRGGPFGRRGLPSQT